MDHIDTPTDTPTYMIRTTDPAGDATSEPAIPPPPTLPKNEKAPWINISTSTFPGDWKKLVNCEDLSDVTFLLGPKLYHAHKYVLCGASEMFRRVFGIEDTIKATSLGEVPTWNKKRMQEVTPENICAGKVAGLKDIQYRLVCKFHHLSRSPNMMFPSSV